MAKSKIISYSLSGYIKYVPSTPALALPVFEDDHGAFFVQEIDEISGLVSDLIPAEISKSEIETVNIQKVVGLGDSAIYCLLLSANPLPQIGHLNSLKSSLENVIADDDAPIGLRIQAAELVGSSSQQRRARNILRNTLSEYTVATAMTYQRSATRVLLWKRLVGAARDSAAAREIRRCLRYLDVDINDNGRVVLLIDDLDKTLCPSIDFSKLSSELEIEIGFSAPSNDDESTPIHEEEMLSLSLDDLIRFMNRRFGADGRISRHTYSWLHEVVSRIGFTSAEQMERAFTGLNSASLCYSAYGNLQGQGTKLELSLLASMGNEYIRRHPWSHSDWFRSNQERLLKKVEASGTKIGTFDIEADAAWRRNARPSPPPPTLFELMP